MIAVFEPTGEPGFYDLMVGGRASSYDVEPDDFAAAIRQARVPSGTKVYVDDGTGYLEPLR